MKKGLLAAALAVMLTLTACSGAVDSGSDTAEDLPRLVIASDNYEPYSYVGPNGNLIGVDVDQSGESNTVITSAMKGLGTSVYDTIAAIYDGTFTGGTNVTLDAAQGGVSLAMDTAKFDTFTQEDYDKLFAALANNTDGIVDGIVNTTSDDGSVASAGLTLSCVTVEEVK